MSDTQWVRDDTWIGTEVDDTLVMVHVDSGKYVSLNATASAVWSALSEPRTAAEVEQAMRARYDVSEEQCRRSVAALLQQMRDLRLAAPV